MAQSAATGSTASTSGAPWPRPKPPEPVEVKWLRDGEPLGLACHCLRIPASCNAPRCSNCNADSMAIRSLIVDDNRSFLEAARVLLEREGLTVADVATTGDEALRKAAALRP